MAQKGFRHDSHQCNEHTINQTNIPTQESHIILHCNIVVAESNNDQVTTYVVFLNISQITSFEFSHMVYMQTGFNLDNTEPLKYM